MATATEEPSPEYGNLTSRRSLHNFSFPPTTLSWRNQRVLRCVNLTTQNDKKGEEEADSSSPSKPWNLRTRRANPNRIQNPNSTQSPNLNLSDSPPPPMVLEADKGIFVNLERSDGENEKKRCEFCVALRKEEMEEDFIKMKGTKLPRRPKKRAKCIQRQLDTLFPGLWLSEITPELYKIDIEKT